MARSNAVGKLRQIIESQQDDPKKALLDALGDLEHSEVLHAQVLVATHAGSKYHPGTKILRTDRDLQEQQFQGSIGLVVAVGPLAFKDDGPNKFGGRTVEPGDWVLYRAADGLQLYINEVPCRLFEDVNIKMRVQDPTIYW
jgi:hypothetical protein